MKKISDNQVETNHAHVEVARNIKSVVEKDM